MNLNTLININKEKYELQLEVVEKLEKADYNGIALLPTGFGKARILIECLKNINPRGRVFYLCDSELNRDQTFKNELIKWGAEKWIDKIEFYCYQTAYKMAGERVELCLCDEFDMALTKEYVKSVTENKFEHLIMVSATLTEDKRAMAEKIRPIVFEIGLQAIEDQGLLNKSRYFEVNYMLTPKENKQYLNFNRKFAELLSDSKKNTQEIEFLKIRRGQFLAGLESSATVCKKILDMLTEQKKRIVVFCNLSKQADKICKHTYHSKSINNNLTEFHEGRIDVLGVVGKLNRGANVGAINSEGTGGPIEAVIFEAPTKSATKFLQRSGRGRRLQAHQTLEVYLLIPYFKNRKGQIVPTVIKKWVDSSTQSIDYKPIKLKI